jgi:signal transduction histidine kinase
MAWTDVHGSRGSFGFALDARSSATRLPALTHKGLVSALVATQAGALALLALDPTATISIALCLGAGLTAALTLTNLTTQRPQASPPQPLMATAPIHAAVQATAPTLIGPDAHAIGIEPMGLPRTDLAAQSQAWIELMGRISHEIRTPLNAIVGFTELMSREIFGPVGHPRYADYVAHIRDSGQALVKSAEDTLALSALLATADPGERPQVSDLAVLIADAWRFVETQAGRTDVALEADIADGIDVNGDRRALRQILMNLMSEAVTRAVPGSAVCVRARISGDIVKLDVRAQNVRPHGRVTTPSLPLCLARALLELQGSSLHAVTGIHGDWHATTILDLGLQPDFFPLPPIGKHSSPSPQR